VSAPIRGAIAAMTRENVIGLDGKIPWHYSEDLKRFKQRTLKRTIIMGRLTWESIGCRELPDRRNIVISRSRVNGVEYFADVNQAINKYQSEDIWIIGGGQIYQAVFNWLTLLDITYVPDVIHSAHAIKFPTIDPQQWQSIQTTPLDNSALVNVVYGRIDSETR
jgi:dihydrofolate reductase